MIGARIGMNRAACIMFACSSQSIHHCGGYCACASIQSWVLLFVNTGYNLYANLILSHDIFRQKELDRTEQKENNVEFDKNTRKILVLLIYNRWQTRTLHYPNILQVYMRSKAMEAAAAVPNMCETTVKSVVNTQSNNHRIKTNINKINSHNRFENISLAVDGDAIFHFIPSIHLLPFSHWSKMK